MCQAFRRESLSDPLETTRSPVGLCAVSGSLHRNGPLRPDANCLSPIIYAHRGASFELPENTPRFSRWPTSSLARSHFELRILGRWHSRAVFDAVGARPSNALPQFAGNLEKIRMAHFVAMLAPESRALFYGEEVGMEALSSARTRRPTRRFSTTLSTPSAHFRGTETRPRSASRAARRRSSRLRTTTGKTTSRR